jgi:polyisoprenoid-binding protein YceI
MPPASEPASSPQAANRQVTISGEARALNSSRTDKGIASFLQFEDSRGAMKTSKFILASILCTFGLSAYSAEKYAIDPVHSSVVFGIKHMGVTNFYAVFNEITGTVTFDAADPSKSSVDITVPVESIDSRNPKRDQHLKSPDFFNVKQFPTLTFKSTKVEKSGDTHKVTGDFTLHGVTKPITIEFNKGPEVKGMAEGELRSGGETRFTIKRSDYGMTFMKDALGDEVSIILSVEGVKQ